MGLLKHIQDVPKKGLKWVLNPSRQYTGVRCSGGLALRSRGSDTTKLLLSTFLVPRSISEGLPSNLKTVIKTAEIA